MYLMKKPADIKDKAALLNSNGLLLIDSKKQYDEAIKTFDQALEAAPTNPLYWCNKGQALFAKNPADPSYLACFKKAQELSQNKVQDGLTKENLAFIKNTLNKFMKVLDMLKLIEAKDDQFIAGRELHYVKKTVEGLRIMKEFDESVVDSKKVLQEMSS